MNEFEENVLKYLDSIDRQLQFINTNLIRINEKK